MVFWKNFTISKTSLNLIEANHAEEFLSRSFTDFLGKKNVKRYSCYTSLYVVSAKHFNCTIRDLPKSLFCKRNGTWIDVLPTITKQYKNREHSPN